MSCIRLGTFTNANFQENVLLNKSCFLVHIWFRFAFLCLSAFSFVFWLLSLHDFILSPGSVYFYNLHLHLLFLPSCVFSVKYAYLFSCLIAFRFILLVFYLLCFVFSFTCLRVFSQLVSAVLPGVSGFPSSPCIYSLSLSQFFVTSSLIPHGFACLSAVFLWFLDALFLLRVCSVFCLILALKLSLVSCIHVHLLPATQQQAYITLLTIQNHYKPLEMKMQKQCSTYRKRMLTVTS